MVEYFGNIPDKIKRRQPVGYLGEFSNQEAAVMFNMIFKVPLNKH
jgi:hypothetical protein